MTTVTMRHTLGERTCLPCGGGIPALTMEEVHQYITELDYWYLTDGHLEKVFGFKNFTEACTFIANLAPIAEAEDHHPDIHLEAYRTVRICLITNAINALSINDFIIAAKIDALMK